MTKEKTVMQYWKETIAGLKPSKPKPEFKYEFGFVLSFMLSLFCYVGFLFGIGVAIASLSAGFLLMAISLPLGFLSATLCRAFYNKLYDMGADSVRRK